LAGTFSKGKRPVRPGAYFNFEALAVPAVPPSVGNVVCVPFTSDWGPMKQAVELGTFSEFIAVYGSNQNTDGFKAVKQAFQGEGVPGSGGAGLVVAYRMGGTAAAKSTANLQNTTPANAVTITAVYEGSRGDSIKLTVRDYAADSTKSELVVYDGAVQVENYVYADADIADLVSQINGSSDWIRATLVQGGVALNLVTSTSLSGGNSGTTLLAADWTAMLSALEISRFGFFAPYKLTDSSILTSIKTWAQNLNSKGKRFTTVVGGALDEAVSAAVTRSTSLNDPDFVNVGVGSVIDENLGVLSTSELVSRVAGILAQRGEAKSLTFARMAGLTIRLGATDAQISTAFDGGVTVLSRDSNVLAPVRIEKGLTTWTTTSDPNRPYAIFRQPKFVSTMHGIEMELGEWLEQNVIGKLAVNDTTRTVVVGETKNRMRTREQLGIVQSGWTVVVDPDPPPSDDDEFVAIVIGMGFGRSVEQVFVTVRFH
jgi:Phage tail sheath protein beta-sandwich domain